MRLVLSVALLIMVCGAGMGLAQDLDMVDPSALAGTSSIPLHADPHDLTDAAECCDVKLFRDKAHALRSGAANIGARGIYDLCLQWRQITAAELQENGRRHADRLAAELERASRALLQHRVLSGRSEG